MKAEGPILSLFTQACKHAQYVNAFGIVSITTVKFIKNTKQDAGVVCANIL